MMGIYIKDIKTPAIVKVHYLNGRRYVEDPQSGEWREMVDIPPHGRLVDADKLESGLRLMAKYQHGERQQSILGCCETIRLAPTIIPAEEERT